MPIANEQAAYPVAQQRVGKNDRRADEVQNAEMDAPRVGEIDAQANDDANPKDAQPRAAGICARGHLPSPPSAPHVYNSPSTTHPRQR